LNYQAKPCTYSAVHDAACSMSLYNSSLPLWSDRVRKASLLIFPKGRNGVPRSPTKPLPRKKGGEVQSGEL